VIKEKLSPNSTGENLLLKSNDGGIRQFRSLVRFAII
jgi:hypothetical protein